MRNHELRVGCSFVGERSHFMKDARELEELPKRIEVLEREQVYIAAHLADGTIYRTDAKRAKQLQARNEEIEAEVFAAMARWEELEKRKS